MSLSPRFGAELLGTFWLVLGGCGSAVRAALPLGHWLILETRRLVMTPLTWVPSSWCYGEAGTYRLGAVMRQFFEFLEAVRHTASRQCSFQQPLGNQIGKPSIGRGRMGVISDREAKVPGRLLAREFNGIFTRSHEFDYGEG